MRDPHLPPKVEPPDLNAAGNEVYIEEIPVSHESILGQPTSVTTFVGRAARGPINTPTLVNSFAQFTTQFGELWTLSTLSYAVRDFFANGGTQAIILRLFNAANSPNLYATLNLNGLILQSSTPGSWANALRARITSDDQGSQNGTFTLHVLEPKLGIEETFASVSTDPNSDDFVTKIVEGQSKLVRVLECPSAVPCSEPTAEFGEAPAADQWQPEFSTGVDLNSLATDGIAPDPATYLGDPGTKTGFYALSESPAFNLLCVPPPTFTTDHAPEVLNAAIEIAESKRALLIIDAPLAWKSAQAAVNGMRNLAIRRSSYAAMFFPRLRVSDRFRRNRLTDFPACGAIAGVFARTDAERGVWKSPAGNTAKLAGVTQLSVSIRPQEASDLNALGVNCLRSTPPPPVVWGSRTLAGFEGGASDYRYISVRRLALFIESSVAIGTQWAVFEPNDARLWANLRRTIEDFLRGLFNAGALMGNTPKEAFFVKCDATTTTQADQNNGIANIVIGFAPIRPSEFVIVKVTQFTSQTA